MQIEKGLKFGQRYLFLNVYPFCKLYSVIFQH